MSGNLINIMQIELKITITNTWRHYDIHTFSQNRHYSIRCIVWRQQNHAYVMLENQQTKRHPKTFKVCPLCKTADDVYLVT